MSHSEAILKRDTWTPILWPLLKGNCLKSVVPVSFRTSAECSLWHTPRWILKKDRWVPVLRSLLKENFQKSVTPVSFRTSLSWFYQKWLPIWATILDAQMRIQQCLNRSFSIWIDFPIARSRSSHWIERWTRKNTALKRECKNVFQPHRSRQISCLLLLTNYSG